MNECLPRWSAAFVLVGLLWPGVGRAQMHHHPEPADTTQHANPKPATHDHSAMSDASMHGGMDMGAMPMRGMYGPYSMSREASGTAWQPDATRHEGVHIMKGAWMIMLHGFADVVYDDQGGHRGDTKVFSNNMGCLLYTSDAADERSSVDLGGRR